MPLSLTCQSERKSIGVKSNMGESGISPSCSFYHTHTHTLPFIPRPSSHVPDALWPVNCGAACLLAAFVFSLAGGGVKRVWERSACASGKNRWRCRASVGMSLALLTMTDNDRRPRGIVLPRARCQMTVDFFHWSANRGIVL